MFFLSFREGQSGCQGKTISDIKRQKMFCFILSWPLEVILVLFSSHADLSFDDLCWWDIRKTQDFLFHNPLSLCHSLSVHRYYLIFFYLPLWITSDFSSKMQILVSLCNQCPLNGYVLLSKAIYFHFLQRNDSNNPQLKSFLKITFIKSRKQLQKEPQSKDQTC